MVHRGDGSAGPFMLTLCRLTEPVSIRPPQSPQLTPFTFFTRRARLQDGSEPLCLHMGFFDTLAHAEKWARAVRGRHPEAVATIAPPAVWPLPDFPENKSLTDTQVLDVLGKRRPVTDPHDIDHGSEQIELLRPDDTGIRRALKEAVVRGAPVAFAVQLHWSVQPIDPSGVPLLEIFKEHTLYAVESRRANRSCFFLRLGFFGDPLSAKEVAFHLRSSFASAAVIPVLDQEIASAQEACAGTSLIPCLVQQRLDHAVEASLRPGPATGSKPASAVRRSGSDDGRTLSQTLVQLAEREIWSDPDVTSDTGVRHLKVEVEKRTPRQRR